MHAAATAFGIVNGVVFVVLAAVALLQWRLRHDRAAGWLVVTFVTLGVVATIGRALPAHPHGVFEDVSQRLTVELLVLFPYLLYRFTTAFVRPSMPLRRFVAALTGAVAVWTLALPRVPATGEPRPSWFIAYLTAFLVEWIVLAVIVAVRLLRAGRGQPSVASSRMRLLAFASGTLAVAIVGVVLVTNKDSAGAVLVQAIATVSGLAYLLGLAPPEMVRAYWREPETLRLQRAIRDLMTLATTRAEVANRVLPSIGAIVGARGAAIVDGEGRVVATQDLSAEALAALEEGEDPAQAAGDETTRVVHIGAPGATILLWTSPYAPFFGDEEMRTLHTLAALVGIALDRVRLFEQEHEARLALEQANEVMTNFVALAAHELRTPVTTIHGFVQTLNHLGHRLSEEQRDELRTGLEQQTARMAKLVEQLLDLSRLDAHAIQVHAQRVDLRRYVEESVAAAAGERRRDVVVDVPDAMQAVVDPTILDRILTNLVTNAFRYGEPPVRVSVGRANGRVRIAVEDAGLGVDRELEQTLFERFTRAGVARDRVPGTGLGLAIARAYAQAHRGDLRYERGWPRGARFVVELPSN